jgi:hypothetical protein
VGQIIQKYQTAMPYSLPEMFYFCMIAENTNPELSMTKATEKPAGKR